MGLAGVEPDGVEVPTKKLNDMVKREVAELKLRLLGGRIEEKETRRAVEALVEYVEKYLKKREWKALVLTLDEANPGLRIGPDLARALLLGRDPDEAVRQYKKETADAAKTANYIFKANVVSYFIDGVPKKGPEYFTPLLESEIDWDTGEVKGKYLFVMLKYNVDTCVNGKFIRVANMTLNPNPEHEGFGFWMRYDDKGVLKVVADASRLHWERYWIPDEQLKKTGRGERMVTAIADSDTVVLGHGNTFVTKSPLLAYFTVYKLNKDLHADIFRDGDLAMLLGGAEKWYNEGARYDIPEQVAMDATKNDALKTKLR
ncbi:MAG: hypothetical protein KGI04_03740 [Candidatus Micrarchaeota archaeon]|nr:hypothetical protein [Candidatus Micrarchaeota archaeon]